VRIAHISDLHVIALEGAVPLRLLNKRLTGYVNLKLVRSPLHQLPLAQAVAREIRRMDVDHVVVTGDLTNLALEREFERARTLLEDDLGASPNDVSVARSPTEPTLSALLRRLRQHGSARASQRRAPCAIPLRAAAWTGGHHRLVLGRAASSAGSVRRARRRAARGSRACPRAP
jgi:3',5'-cyclic AMP phosphodiesterase CpdA